MIDAGWTMNDIDNSDYHYLLHLFGEVDNENEKLDGADFIKQFLSADDLQKLNDKEVGNGR